MFVSWSTSTQTKYSLRTGSVVSKFAFVACATRLIKKHRCDPTGIRIQVCRMRTCRPRPLDDGANSSQIVSHYDILTQIQISFGFFLDKRFYLSYYSLGLVIKKTLS